MRQVYPDEGLTTLLKIIVHNGGDGLEWALFVNDVNPGLDTELADLVLAGAWGTVVLDETDFTDEQVVAHVGTIQGDPVIFTNNTGGGVNIYGYAVIEAGTQKLLMCRRFEGAPFLVLNAATFAITPVLGDYSDSFVPYLDGGTF